MEFLFSLIMGFIEKLFVSELEKYIETEHQKRTARDIANAPVSKSELIDSFK